MKENKRNNKIANRILIVLILLFILFLLFNLGKYFYAKSIFTKLSENENKYENYCVIIKNNGITYSKQEEKIIKTANYARDTISTINSSNNKEIFLDRWKDINNNYEIAKTTVNTLETENEEDILNTDDYYTNKTIYINNENIYGRYEFFENKQQLLYADFYWTKENSLFENIIANLAVLVMQPSIKTKNVDGKDCYSIKYYYSFGKGIEYLIEKDTYLLIETIEDTYDNEQAITTYEYNFDVTEDDLELPNLSEYYVSIQ